MKIFRLLSTGACRTKWQFTVPKQKQCFISSVQKQSSIQEYQPNLKINSTPIEISKQEKLLGITMDNTLNWSAQVEATIKM